MSRVRISTTIDAQRLEEARRLTGAKDSQLLDRALATLVEMLRTEQELTALAAHPYETDSDLAWEVPPGPDLPYDGAVPDEVRAMAEKRRRGTPRA